ncbi:helix-turn-helix transcriptional regulator [Mycobacterium sp. Aquia_216]|uniref:helix-turn-helix domain-containing protein n=1 Tax=Mycobacterium sp. Aquia_216 TaxID=2991729 RepID=UPI00227BCCA6|nr:helix-turn-helix transcriptional regulator [Mycobacterium sp. Aquia_216]WAJ43592.1 helix-turn-helix transcriptional regulator [Mycobacterium sp. Aquia_216]
MTGLFCSMRGVRDPAEVAAVAVVFSSGPELRDSSSGATGDAVRQPPPLGFRIQSRVVHQPSGGGHTNQAIAVRLFISPRTVERHLNKIFPKLHSARRQELRTTRGDAT